MAKYRVFLEQEARDNIDAIYGWLAERTSEGALRWYRALLKSLAKLVEDDGKTPWHYAIDTNHADMVASLVANGTELTVIDERGLSPLACAAKEYTSDAPSEEREMS